MKGRINMNMKVPYSIKNYWTNVGISFLIAIIANLVIGLVLGSDAARFVYLILAIYWIVIEVRRFNDANKSGWLALINLIPGIGTLAALVTAGVMKSDYDNNRWM